MKKLWFDVLLAIGIILLMALRLKSGFDPDIQVVLNKMVQVNIGLIHAWIAGRIFFGEVDWKYAIKFIPRNVGRLIMLLVIVWAYAVGG